MNRRTLMLVVAALVLGLLYGIYFTDWFQARRIAITPMVRAGSVSKIPRADELKVYPVVFKLDTEYALTSIRVVVASEYEANRHAAAMWHVVGDPSSKPMDVILYGGAIAGMKPRLERTKPRPLDPNVPYLLLIEAGSAKGEVRFTTREVVRPPA